MALDSDHATPERMGAELPPAFQVRVRSALEASMAAAQAARPAVDVATPAMTGAAATTTKIPSTSPTALALYAEDPRWR